MWYYEHNDVFTISNKCGAFWVMSTIPFFHLFQERERLDEGSVAIMDEGPHEETANLI